MMKDFKSLKNYYTKINTCMSICFMWSDLVYWIWVLGYASTYFSPTLFSEWVSLDSWLSFTSQLDALRCHNEAICRYKIWLTIKLIVPFNCSHGILSYGSFKMNLSYRRKMISCSISSAASLLSLSENVIFPDSKSKKIIYFFSWFVHSLCLNYRIASVLSLPVNCRSASGCL